LTPSSVLVSLTVHKALVKFAHSPGVRSMTSFRVYWVEGTEAVHEPREPGVGFGHVLALRAGEARERRARDIETWANFMRGCARDEIMKA